MSLSSSGPGRWPLTPETGVQIPAATLGDLAEWEGGSLQNCYERVRFPRSPLLLPPRCRRQRLRSWWWRLARWWGWSLRELFELLVRRRRQPDARQIDRAGEADTVELPHLEQPFRLEVVADEELEVVVEVPIKSHDEIELDDTILRHELNVTRSSSRGLGRWPFKPATVGSSPPERMRAGGRQAVRARARLPISPGLITRSKPALRYPRRGAAGSAAALGAAGRRFEPGRLDYEDPRTQNGTRQVFYVVGGPRADRARRRQEEKRRAVAQRKRACLGDRRSRVRSPPARSRPSSGSNKQGRVSSSKDECCWFESSPAASMAG